MQVHGKAAGFERAMHAVMQTPCFFSSWSVQPKGARTWDFCGAGDAGVRSLEPRSHRTCNQQFRNWLADRVSHLAPSQGLVSLLLSSFPSLLLCWLRTSFRRGKEARALSWFHLHATFLKYWDQSQLSQDSLRPLAAVFKHIRALHLAGARAPSEVASSLHS